MEDGDVLFVDSGRNATPHRATIVPAQPVSRAVVVPAGSGPRVSYASAPTWPSPPSWGYSQNPAFWGATPFAQPPVYAQPPFSQPGTLGAIFGGLNGVNIGSLIDLIGQGFAAIRTLPAPPAPTGDVGTDVVNSVTYDTALAQHAQTTEQIIAASHIIGKLLGA